MGIPYFTPKLQNIQPWQPTEEAREFITPNRIGQAFAPALQNDLPLEAYPRSHPYAQPLVMSGMRYENVDEKDVEREAHLLKTRKHVWRVQVSIVAPPPGP